MNTFSKHIICSLLVFGALGIGSAYAKTCSIDYGIGNPVNSRCTAFKFDRDFQGYKGQTAVLACASRSADKSFSVRGNVRVVTEKTAGHPYVFRHGRNRMVEAYKLKETGPTNFVADPVTVTGEGQVFCSVHISGGVSPHRAK